MTSPTTEASRICVTALNGVAEACGSAHRVNSESLVVVNMVAMLAEALSAPVTGEGPRRAILGDIYS